MFTLRICPRPAPLTRLYSATVRCCSPEIGAVRPRLSMSVVQPPVSGIMDSPIALVTLTSSSSTSAATASWSAPIIIAAANEPATSTVLEPGALAMSASFASTVFTHLLQAGRASCSFETQGCTTQPRGNGGTATSTLLGQALRCTVHPISFPGAACTGPHHGPLVLPSASGRGAGNGTDGALIPALLPAVDAELGPFGCEEATVRSARRQGIASHV